MAGLSSHRRAVAVAALPAVALLLASLFSAPGPKGLFQADLAGLVAAVGCGAFAVPRGRLALPFLALAAVLCALAHAALAGALGGAPAVALLVLAAGVAPAGLAAAGRAVGAPPLAAGTVAAGVLWVAMTGLFWADGLAETLPPARQYRFRQAVLHLDLATACAYGGARFDRFRDPRVYRDVQLASSLVRPPSAGPTGGVWLAVGLLAFGVSVLLGADRSRAHPDATPDAPVEAEPPRAP